MGKLKTGQLYDDYSFARRYDNFFSEEGIESLKDVLINDLEIAGVYSKMSELSVLDVGTGRQALVFALLNAKKVDHYDISIKTVNRFKQIIESKYNDLPISTTNLDLCKDPLPKYEYDFVYYAGIIMHFSNPQKGLINGANSVKRGGLIWIMFYRSGTFKWLICSMIRKLINEEEIDLYFYASALFYGNGDLSNWNSLYIMDDFFNPYIHLYPPHDYIDFFMKAGFEICATNHLDPLSRMHHYKAYHSGVIAFKRQKK